MCLVVDGEVRSNANLIGLLGLQAPSTLGVMSKPYGCYIMSSAGLMVRYIPSLAGALSSSGC